MLGKGYALQLSCANKDFTFAFDTLNHCFHLNQPRRFKKSAIRMMCKLKCDSFYKLALTSDQQELE